MNPVFLIAGVFLFVSGILLGRQSQSPASKIFGLTSTQTEQSPSETPTPTNTPDTTLTPTPSATPTVTPKPMLSPTLKPNPTSAGNSTTLSDFKYPGSSTTEDSNGRLTLSSSDSPATITSWYENRIKELGYSSRASAKTNTNGNVTNKLGGGKNNSSVNIQIVKKATDTTTTIQITQGTDSGSDVHIKIENNEPYM